MKSNYFGSKVNDELNLCNSFLGEQCIEELKEIDKHEIIVKICEKIGPCPSNFNIAESIFEEIRFDIARYVLHHEFCRENNIKENLLIWLENRTNPDKLEKFSSFCEKYLK